MKPVKITRIPTPSQKHEMITAMDRYGGSFVKALAECFLIADRDNYERLCIAFPEYVEQYLKSTESEPHIIGGTE